MSLVPEASRQRNEGEPMAKMERMVFPMTEGKHRM
jgi:hypothetical protein